MFATAPTGGPSTPSEEIVVFDELEEAELGERKAEQEEEEVQEGEEEQAVGKNILDQGKVVEARTEYDVAVFKRLLWEQRIMLKTPLQDGHWED